MVRNNKVIAIVECEEESTYQEFAKTSLMIDITDSYPMPEIGWLFNGVVLTKPDATIGFDTRVTPLALRNRFVIEEMVAITAAAASNPVVRVLLDNLAIAKYVDLNDTLTQNGIFALVAFGLLSSERASEILTTPPTKIELAFGGES